MDSDLSNLFVATVIAMLALPGFGYFLGGDALAKKIGRAETKILRIVIGTPIIWIGQGIVWLGKQTRG